MKHFNRITQFIDTGTTFHVSLRGETCIEHAGTLTDAIALHGMTSLVNGIPLSFLCIYATNANGQDIEQGENGLLIDIGNVDIDTEGDAR